MKFWSGFAQVMQGGFELRASQFTVTGNKRRRVIVSGEQQFTVEWRRRHHSGSPYRHYGVLGASTDVAQQALIKAEGISRLVRKRMGLDNG